MTLIFGILHIVKCARRSDFIASVDRGNPIKLQFEPMGRKKRTGIPERNRRKPNIVASHRSRRRPRCGRQTLRRQKAVSLLWISEWQSSA